MKIRMRSCFLAMILLLVAFVSLAGNAIGQTYTKAGKWTDSFNVEQCSFLPSGKNSFFILESGYQLTLKGIEDEDSVTLVITVLNETKVVDGVETRVVEERESVGNNLIEVSRNFFAFCRDYSSVFYFGEDVDMYKNGKIVSHDGSWKAGQNGFKPGLMMPGLPLAGASYYQEVAPEVAMDRSQIVTADTTIQSPTRTYEHCLVTEETSALEPNSKEYKYYAPGVGLIRDGDLWLISRRH